MMLRVKTVLAYSALVLALVVSAGTSEDVEESDAEKYDQVDDNNLIDFDFKDIEPDYQELLLNLQNARAKQLEFDDMSSRWKKAQEAAGWKRAQAAAGWKRQPSAAAGWKRGQSAAAGWKREQSAAAGWKRAKGASGWKRDNPIDLNTRGGENWRNSNSKSAASGWKRTARSANRQQIENTINQLP